VCLNQNNIKLYKKKVYFGGNFYCDCGAGNLEHPCKVLAAHCNSPPTNANNTNDSSSKASRLPNESAILEQLVARRVSDEVVAVAVDAPTAMPPQQHEQHQVAQI
jgi:hypothetical protein